MLSVATADCVRSVFYQRSRPQTRRSEVDTHEASEEFAAATAWWGDRCTGHSAITTITKRGGMRPSIEEAAREAFKHLHVYVQAHFVAGNTREASPAAVHAYLCLKRALEPYTLLDIHSGELVQVGRGTHEYD